MSDSIASLAAVSIPVETLNRVVNYLGSKPFVEVAGLIGEIQNLVQQNVQRNVVALKPQQEAVAAPKEF